MSCSYDLCVARPLLKDACKAILSTILFHRLIGTNVPQTRNVFGPSSGSGQRNDAAIEDSTPVAYPALSDPHVDALIEECVSRAENLAATNITTTPRTQKILCTIQLRFLRQPVLPDTPATEQVGRVVVEDRPDAAEVADSWELWAIRILEYATSKPPNDKVHIARAVTQVKSILTNIVSRACAQRAQIPAIVTVAVAPFAYTLAVIPGEIPEYSVGAERSGN
ncbi:uncharacterized protein SAPINGB_P000389 [Magnusiomyces paraingens]|uniref:Uncharacterized protein n=1 Tax=Magnusiomyces paraingens TaxID=2606893 RepID=A0A5E8AZC8_9ASCO|nr:uncharacterized protein SAPINGB_P000389 [Saprochaete ingens]VVT44357.1 unnamed protein product [Saprochaete ingens]